MLRSDRGLEACTSIAQNGVCGIINLLVYNIGGYKYFSNYFAMMDVWHSPKFAKKPAPCRSGLPVSRST